MSNILTPSVIVDVTPTPTITLSPEMQLFYNTQTEIDEYFNNDNPHNQATTKLALFDPTLINTADEDEDNRYELAINKLDRSITTQSIYEKDIHQTLNQQNALYVVGTITCATLLISAILIAR